MDDHSFYVDILMRSVFNESEIDRTNDSIDSDETLNLTNTTTSTESPPSIFHVYPQGLLEFAATSCVLFIIIGVPGNLLTVIALLKTPRLRNATTAFIVNLCLADAFFCVSSLPLAASTFLRKEWVHGEFMCVVFPMIRYTNVAVSLFTVLAITINRYVLICHPTKYHKIYTKCNMVFYLIFLWIISVALLFPTLIGVWGRFGYDPAVGTCSIVKVNGKSSKTFIYILCFALPTTVFLTCYARIFCVVRKSSKNFQPSDSRATSQQKDLRLLKIVAVIYGTFVLCFVPVAVVKILMKENDLPVMNVFGYLGVFVSACLNPIIYVAMSKEYRKAYANLLTCSKSK